jgi:hypothetical protein
MRQEWTAIVGKYRVRRTYRGHRNRSFFSLMRWGRRACTEVHSIVWRYVPTDR